MPQLGHAWRQARLVNLENWCAALTAQQQHGLRSQSTLLPRQGLMCTGRAGGMSVGPRGALDETRIRKGAELIHHHPLVAMCGSMLGRSLTSKTRRNLSSCRQPLHMPSQHA